LFGSDGTRNAVHGSDSSASVAREVAFFFPDLPADAGAVLRGNEALAYIATALQPTLVKALTALAKAKPSSDQVRGAQHIHHLLEVAGAHGQIVWHTYITACPRKHVLLQAEALDFLATWLLENNPNQPRLVVPKAACAEAMMAAGAAAASTAAECLSGGGAQQLGSSTPTPDTANEAAVKERAQARQDAATKVQAAIRGHQARRHVADMRASAQTAAAM
jgi:nucleoside-diphosphate kinase